MVHLNLYIILECSVTHLQPNGLTALQSVYMCTKLDTRLVNCYTMENNIVTSVQHTDAMKFIDLKRNKNPQTQLIVPFTTKFPGAVHKALQIKPHSKPPHINYYYYRKVLWLCNKPCKLSNYPRNWTSGGVPISGYAKLYYEMLNRSVSIMELCSVQEKSGKSHKRAQAVHWKETHYTHSKSFWQL